MHIKLPPAQVDFIEQKIALGDFPSTDALISEAISLMQQREHWVKDATSKIDQGWTEAKSGFLVSEEILIQELSVQKAAFRSARVSK